MAEPEWLMSVAEASRMLGISRASLDREGRGYLHFDSIARGLTKPDPNSPFAKGPPPQYLPVMQVETQIRFVRAAVETFIKTGSWGGAGGTVDVGAIADAVVAKLLRMRRVELEGAEATIDAPGDSVDGRLPRRR